MTASELERVETLLKNYDEHLRNKAEHYADMMADWADASEDETRRYAEKYSTVRVERQRLQDSLRSIKQAFNELNKAE